MERKYSMASDKTIQATADSFAAEVTEAPGLVLVDFWAPWCGPCRAIAPVLDEIAEAYEGRVKVIKVNTDDERDLARRHSVMSIPTLLLFQDGQMAERMVGACSQADLSAALDKFLTLGNPAEQTDAEPTGQEEG